MVGLLAFGQLVEASYRHLGSSSSKGCLPSYLEEASCQVVASFQEVASCLEVASFLEEAFVLLPSFA